MNSTSRQVCQPGLSTRPPATRIRALRSRSPPMAARARLSDSSLRPIPASSCIDSCRVRWSWSGFSPSPTPPPASGRSTASCSAAICCCETAARGPALLAKSAAAIPGAAAEDQDVPERVAPQAVGAVKARRHLAGGVEAGHRGRCGLGVDPDAAHGVVDGGAHLHRLLGDVDPGQGLELVDIEGSVLRISAGLRRLAMSRKAPPWGVPRPASPPCRWSGPRRRGSRGPS